MAKTLKARGIEEQRKLQQEIELSRAREEASQRGYILVQSHLFSRLMEASEKTLTHLETMTTEEFMRGVDRTDRDALRRAVWDMKRSMDNLL